MERRLPQPLRAETTGKTWTATQHVSRMGRRPLLHVIVIYASTASVVKYANRTAEKFVASGLDVYVQTTPTGAPKVAGCINGTQERHNPFF